MREGGRECREERENVRKEGMVEWKERQGDGREGENDGGM